MEHAQTTFREPNPAKIPKEHRILYVDDEAANLRIFKTRFKRNYQVFTAESGPEALEILKNEDIHLLITDQKMPEMTGVELLERTVDDYPDLVRIILTGYADIDAIVKAVNKCGIYKYITKPYVQEELIITFDKALESAKLKKEKNSLLDELTDVNEKLTAANAALEEKMSERTAELNEAHEHLTQSLEHAKTVQQALLPSKDALNEFLKESFAFYKPLQIVSGDFYWFYPLEEEKKAVLIVFDCMGHGVPGSMNTMIVYGLLNKIVGEFGLTNPASILRRLNEGVLDVFNYESTGTEETVDAGVVTLDYRYRKITYAGAKSDLVIEKDGEYNRIRGSRFSVGSTMNKGDKYETTEVLMDPDSTYYLFSDGFQDQMNEDYSRKLGFKGFTEALRAIGHLEFEKRSEGLGLILDEWMGSGPQVDDIAVLGFKV